MSNASFISAAETFDLSAYRSMIDKAVAEPENVVVLGEGENLVPTTESPTDTSMEIFGPVDLDTPVQDPDRMRAAAQLGLMAAARGGSWARVLRAVANGSAVWARVGPVVLIAERQTNELIIPDKDGSEIVIELRQPA